MIHGNSQVQAALKPERKVNSRDIDKLFNQAKKELGLRTTSSITPNLSSQGNQVPERQLDSLKIASINSNSSVSLQKRVDLHDLATFNDFDIIFVCETKLKKSHRIEFSEYDFFKTNRTGGQKGGTAILIKRNLEYEKIYFPSSRRNQIFEHTIIKIKTGQNNLFLVAIYANNDASHHFTDELSALFTGLNFDSRDNYYVVAGDFNARNISWGDTTTSRKGILLKRWLDSKGTRYRARIITPCTCTPTFLSANSFLDLCLLDNRIFVSDLVNERLPVFDYPSDHKALGFTVTLPVSISCRDPTHSFRFMFKKTKWKKFSKDLATNYISTIPDNRNLTNEEITNHLLDIQNFITEKIDSGVPRYKPRDNMLNYVNRKIRALHKNKFFLITYLNRLQ